MKTKFVLLILFNAIWLFDMISTAFIIRVDPHYESNPILLWYIVKFGIIGFIAVKIWINGLVVFMFEIAYFGNKISLKGIKICYIFLIVFYISAYFSLYNLAN